MVTASELSILQKSIADIHSYIPNCFFQRFFIKQFFSNDECTAIVDEIKMCESVEEKYINYKKIIDKLPNPKYLLSFIIKTLDAISDKYNIIYNLETKNPILNIVELFISKTNCIPRNDILDDGMLVFNILLSDTTNVLTYEDNIKYMQNKGDMLLYCGHIMKYSESFDNITFLKKSENNSTEPMMNCNEHRYALIGKINIEYR